VGTEGLGERQELRIIRQFWKYRARFFADIEQRRRDAVVFAEIKALSKADQWVLAPSDLGCVKNGLYARGEKHYQPPASKMRTEVITYDFPLRGVQA
jgi:hypothetical protein